MRIVDISVNDDTRTIAQKCNTNFKQLAFDASQGTRSQSQLDQAAVSQALSAVNNRVDGLTNRTIPDEVTRQVNEKLPGLVAQEVARQMPEPVDTTPPMGSYLLFDTSPEGLYEGTLWEQVGTLQLSDELGIPVWKRVESKGTDPEGGDNVEEEG